MEAKMSLFDKKVGDGIEVELDRYGKFSATLQKIEGDLFVFMFDDCIVHTSMNQEDTNKGGYKESYMEQFLSTDVYNSFPEDIRVYIKEVTLATVGQIFGHEDEWCNKYLVMDKEEQFPLMKKRQNRIACFNGDTCWWWLQNRVKEEHSSAFFAYVDGNGDADYDYASGSYGVRPAFVLVKPTSGGRVPQGNKVSYRNYYHGKDKRPTREELIAEINYRREEIAELHKQISELERFEVYDNAAGEMKTIMDSFVRAGFTEDQAFEIMQKMTISLLEGR